MDIGNTNPTQARAEGRAEGIREAAAAVTREILENDKQRAIVAADMLYCGALPFHPASFRQERIGYEHD